MTRPKLSKAQREWETECMHFYGRVLTGKDCHWCGDWDGLPIDETCPEYEACTETPAGRAEVEK